MSDHSSFVTSTVDWRQSLRTNNRRTFFVIFLFLIIYIAVGLLVDLAIYTDQYPQAPLAVLFQALIQFKLIPYATLVMLGIACVSLLVTYSFYDKLMLLGTDYHEITAATATTAAEKQLYNVVEEMKIAAGLQFMPRVFVINASYMNAFASGYSEKSAMVAITQGLIEKLNRDELQAVMAHELSHIRHMDIKLTLTASLLANLMVMVLDILFYNVVFSNRQQRSKNSLMSIIILLRYLLPLINIFLLLYLSRTREYMADAGAVELMRANEPLANALLKIQHDYQTTEQTTTAPHDDVRRAAYIFDPRQAGIRSMASLNDFFSTHPTLAARLAAIGIRYKDSGGQS